MKDTRIDELIAVYRDDLLHDTLPFWIEHGVDERDGGFLLCLDRHGALLDDDKGIWQQARFTWLLATLAAAVEPRDEWVRLARHGVDFLTRHAFDDDGRMFFLVTRDGRPLRKRRYVFTEMFGAIAFAATARATGDDELAARATSLFELARHLATTPGLLPPKVDPATRRTRGLAMPMITIATAQVLRQTLGYEPADRLIDDAIGEIERYHMKPELQAVMETVGVDGELLDHFDGRLLNPGHAIEAAWFILEESKVRGGDRRLTRLGCTILDWMWARGWDDEHGGLFYFRDVHHRPVSEYWHAMKFWWPHNEAVLATLLAHQLTGDPRYEELHRRVHDYAHQRFKDEDGPEWFGYLHRDGSVSSELKGNNWKGPFHLPRMQLYGWKILEQMRSGVTSGPSLTF